MIPGDERDLLARLSEVLASSMGAPVGWTLCAVVYVTAHAAETKDAKVMRASLDLILGREHCRVAYEYALLRQSIIKERRHAETTE